MNYSEFRKTYAWMIKAYPETSEIYRENFSGSLIGKCITEQYEKSGKTWKKISENRKDVSPEYYSNVIDAIPFFRNLGGFERVECAYTVRGYLPVKVISISPDKEKKTVRIFKFF